MQLRLEEKRSGTAPASTAKFPVAQNRPPGQGRGRARDVARDVSVEGAGARDEKTDDAEAREKEVQEAATVLKAEAENMRKEIAEQERLLQAYQKENERLLEKAKEVSFGRTPYIREVPHPEFVARGRSNKCAPTTCLGVDAE